MMTQPPIGIGRRGFYAAITVALCGCAVGPDFVRPAPPHADTYATAPPAETTASVPIAGGEAQHFTSGADIPAQWWTLFHSPALSALVERALQANPTVEGAAAALRVAQENVYAQQGAFFPSVSGELSASREKDATGVLSPTAANGGAYLNLRTAQLNVSYVADVFGASRRQVESLQAQAENQRFLLRAARLTLSANVVATAVQIAALSDQVAATEATIASAREQCDVMQRQVELGAIAEAGLIAQRALLAQTEALLPPLRKQLAQQRDLLAALTGLSPGEAPAADFKLSDFTLPHDVPVSLPSTLVEQRPDVRAAEALLHAASAQIGVALANRLPQITLTAAAGSSATRASDLFKSGTTLWNIAAGLTQPIFDGGTLLHRQRAAEAAYDQAFAQYRSTVLVAFENVADALQVLQLDADALRTTADAESRTADALRVAQRQVELGDTSQLLLLIAQQAYQQARINRIQALAARLADTAALFQALGGGWWNERESAALTGAN
jgi:NodT family efflux transporter outer membrane factor (OMF) lipoprotein